MLWSALIQVLQSLKTIEMRKGDEIRRTRRRKHPDLE